MKRRAARGRYDRATIDGILDEGLVCHVGFPVDGGVAVVPTAYVRDGDDLVLHGSSGNRMLRAIRDDAEVSICVTILDGLVLARSTFHHSMNYRAVVLYGRGSEIREPDGKRRALELFVEHVVPGRSGDARPPSDDELRQTLVVRIPITEASAKVRSGPPIDDEADLALAHWAGEIPLRLAAGSPVAAPEVPADMPPPAHVTAWARPSRS